MPRPSDAHYGRLNAALREANGAWKRTEDAAARLAAGPSALRAVVLELLRAADIGTGRAAIWVATEARRWKLRAEDGAPITAKQIQSWRSEVSEGAGASRRLRDLGRAARHAGTRHDTTGTATIGEARDRRVARPCGRQGVRRNLAARVTPRQARQFRGLIPR